MTQDHRATGAPASTAPAVRSTGRRQRGMGLALRWLQPSPAPTGLTPFGSRALVLGRDAGCDFLLRGNEASRRHAQIEAATGRSDAGDVAVTDLQSKNGTFVNGARVARAQLGIGDVVRLGEWVGLVVGLDPREAQVPLFSEIFAGMWGGPTLARILSAARKVAPTDLPVVVVGETGTGKERVSQALHGWSGRQGSFCAVNCAALPEHLAEGELFGYRKGAFTGADRAHPGFFQSASGGTLLLDEIVELSPAIQAKLLRVLEQREVHPLGEPAPRPIDVRVLAAAQVPLSEACERLGFRSDLHARLDGLTIELPALRDRKEDVLPLFQQFLREALGSEPMPLEPELAEALLLYGWPQNVRELHLLARRMLALHGHEPLLKRSHLPERIQAALDSSKQVQANPLAALRAALIATKGNVTEAARRCGISRQRAYRMIESEALDLDALREADSVP